METLMKEGIMTQAELRDLELSGRHAPVGIQTVTPAEDRAAVDHILEGLNAAGFD